MKKTTHCRASGVLPTVEEQREQDVLPHQDVDIPVISTTDHFTEELNNGRFTAIIQNMKPQYENFNSDTNVLFILEKFKIPSQRCTYMKDQFEYVIFYSNYLI